MTQGYPQYEIGGIGFDATCSMVAIDTENNPLTVSTTGECVSLRLIGHWASHGNCVIILCDNDND